MVFPWSKAATCVLSLQKDGFGVRSLQALEYSLKGPLFGCRICGNCLLQETALICPMECPKGLRNGPCGGSAPKYCFVHKTQPCMWYKIYESSFQLERQELLLGKDANSMRYLKYFSATEKLREQEATGKV